MCVTRPAHVTSANYMYTFYVLAYCTNRPNYHCIFLLLFCILTSL